jgi:hypothetical protein
MAETVVMGVWPEAEAENINAPNTQTASGKNFCMGMKIAFAKVLEL